MAQRWIVPALFLFLFALPLVFATPFDDCKVLGNCQPPASKGGGSGSTNITNNYYNVTSFAYAGKNPALYNDTTFIYLNLSYLNSIYYNSSNPFGFYNSTTLPAQTNYNASGLILNWTNQQDNNASGLIKDWNNTGLIINWSSLLNGTGLIKDWNSTGFIKDWNMSGYIQNWNNTGYIRDWSSLINGLLSQSTADTLYYPKYNNIANYYNSSNFNISSFYNSSNPSNFYNSSNFNISTFYNASNPFSFYNSTTLPSFGNLNGQGTATYIPLWNGTTSLNNSVMYQSSGKIGINTINPSYLLDIEGTSSGGGILINGTNPAIALGNASQTLGYATTAGAFAGNAQIGDVILRSQDGHNLILNTGTGNAEFSVNGTNGNIGIGTINPTSALDLESGDFYINRNNGIYFNVAGVGTRAKILSDSSNNLMFGNSVFYPILNLTLDGNVIVQNDLGIGTNNPQNNLNVIGVTNTTSSLYALSSTFSVFAAGNVTRMAIVAQNNTAYSMITMNPDYSQATKQWNIGVNSTGSNGQIFFADAGGIGGTRMVIGSGSNNGFVGIGTTNPQNALNVIGDINATTSIYSNGKNITELIKYLDNGTFYLASNPNSYVSNTSGLVLNWTNQPDNNKSGLIKDWNQSGYITNSNNTGLILNWTNQADHNESGLIKDWNQSGILINWNNSMNATGLLVNYSNLNPNNYVSNSSGLVINWNNSINSTGLIQNWTNQQDNNKSGLIKDWNSTGFIKDWSYLSGGSGITNGSSAWLQNLSVAGDFLVDNGLFNVSAASNDIQMFDSNNKNGTITTILKLRNTNTSQNNTFTGSSIDFESLNSTGANFTSARIREFNYGQFNETNQYNGGLAFSASGTTGVLTDVIKMDSTGVGIFADPSQTLYALSMLSGRGLNITDTFGTSSASTVFLQRRGTNFGTILEISNLGGQAGNPVYGLFSSASKPQGVSGVFIGNFYVHANATGDTPATYTNTGPYGLKVAMMNQTGTFAADGGQNLSLIYTGVGNILNLTSIGAVGLPPTQNMTCVSTANTTFRGVMMKNDSGVYGCPTVVGPSAWVKLF